MSKAKAKPAARRMKKTAAAEPVVAKRIFDKKRDCMLFEMKQSGQAVPVEGGIRWAERNSMTLTLYPDIKNIRPHLTHGDLIAVKIFEGDPGTIVIGAITFMGFHVDRTIIHCDMGEQS